MGLAVIRGKTYRVTDANDVIKNNTDEDLVNHFTGDGIDAKWTRHILDINEKLNQQTYKAGRPFKNKPAEQTEREM